MTALEFVKQKAIDLGYEEDIYDLLTQGIIHREMRDVKRWWIDIFYVTKFKKENIYIGWMGAILTGGSDWDFNLNTIEYVEPYETTVIKYKKVEGE